VEIRTINLKEANNMAFEETHKKTVPENVEDKPATAVSKHTTKNPQPAMKSKQPARRKAKSTFQPSEHGRMAQLFMFDGQGKALKGFEDLFQSLANRFDASDVVNALLIEMTVADYWRISKGLAHEVGLLGPRCDNFHPQGAMPVVIRYVATARRNLNTSMQMLLQLEKEAAEAGAFAAEAEEQASAMGAASPSQPSSTAAESDEQSTPAATHTSADEVAVDEPQLTAAESTVFEGAAETPAVDTVGEKLASDLPAAA
jgi:hypothetical protein